MVHQNIIKDGIITAFADATLFAKETIFKCLYWYGDKFHTSVSLDNNIYCISLKALSTVLISEDDLEMYLLKLERDLIDFQLRDLIIKETVNIRDILVAKAFSNGEFDELPPGDISDPVGFNPNLV